MPQSLAKNYVHIIFSTKYRQPFITDDIDDALFAYLGAMCKDMDCQPIKIGGYRDHVHILCLLSRKVAMMDLLEEIKAHSSKWMKTQGHTFKNFYWQDGYAAFSVSPTGVDRVIRYIENQKKHHQKIKFQDEMRIIFKKNKIDYNETYVWD
jgi:putative transposase